jgi:Zn-dependent protease
MSWSFRIVRIAGTDVRIHVTFVLFLAWIGGAYYLSSGLEAAWDGVGLMLAVFLCVLLHEFGHAFAARAFGIRTPDITMLPIGGLARLERMPDKPSEELVVAVAGPAVNVVIAIVLIFVFGQQLHLQVLESLEDRSVPLLTKLAAVNVSLVLFNLIPAFPMDGGRVLRALLAMRMNHARATQIAARVGQGLAFLFGFAGLFGNPMLLFIALFVFLGASQEATAAQMKDLSAQLRVADAMVTQVLTLDDHATLDEAVEALLRTSQHEFPVVDDTGFVRGILTRDAMISALKRGSGATPVVDVMHRDLPFVRDYAPFEEAFSLMNTCGCPAIPVLDRHDRLVGLITPENIGELMLVQSLRKPGEIHTWRSNRRPPSSG